MVYIHSWHEFEDAAEELYKNSPDKVSWNQNWRFFNVIPKKIQARYCVKWKSSEGKLVLKVTDNTSVSSKMCDNYETSEMCLFKCIKFKTNSSIFLNRFEALNVSLMEKMQNRQKKEEPPPAIVQDVPRNELLSSLQAGTSSAVPTQIPSGAGVKKKKTKKKRW